MPSFDPKTPLPAASPTPRPDIELAEIAVLEALAAEGQTIVAEPGGGELMFRSRLRFVDPGRQYIVVEQSTSAVANAALLARPSTLFCAEVNEWRIEFSAADPEQIVHEGAPAIRLRFPEFIASHRRREYERAPVPPQLSLRCVAYLEDVMYFEASIIDISRGGIGILQYSPDTELVAGMIFRGCQIERPGKDPLMVDLEVRYTGPAAFADGRPAQRAGCRFLNVSRAAIDLSELVEGVSGEES